MGVGCRGNKTSGSIARVLPRRALNDLSYLRIRSRLVLRLMRSYEYQEARGCDRNHMIYC